MVAKSLTQDDPMNSIQVGKAEFVKEKSIFLNLIFNYLKTFQNLRVSSPAPVTIASPSGDIAR